MFETRVGIYRESERKEGRGEERRVQRWEGGLKCLLIVQWCIFVITNGDLYISKLTSS